MRAAEQEVLMQSSSAWHELLMSEVQGVTNLPKVSSSIIVNYACGINCALMSLIEERYIPSDEECYQAIKQEVAARYADDPQENDGYILKYYELKELENKILLSQEEQSRMMQLRVKEQEVYWKTVSLNVKRLYEQQPRILREKSMEKTVQRVRTLLEQRADPNARDWYGDEPLHLTAGDDDKIGITRLLLQHRADINAHDGTEDGWTPLHRAVIYQQVESVRLLIEKKAEVNKLNAFNKRHQTPLQVAMEHTQPRADIIKLLKAAQSEYPVKRTLSRWIPVPEEKNNMEKHRTQKIMEPPHVEEQRIGSLKYPMIVFAGVVVVSYSAQIIKKQLTSEGS